MKVKLKKEIKVGDLINYFPRNMQDGKHLGVEVIESLPAGEIFNQSMLVIKELPHWIPAWDCELSEED